MNNNLAEAVSWLKKNEPALLRICAMAGESPDDVARRLIK